MAWLDWIEDKLWGKPLASFPKITRFFLGQLRLLARALRGFLEDDCSQRSAALTFFTFFSLPSLLAVCFGIAKGFGLQDQTDTWVRKGLESQPQVAEFLIDFGIFRKPGVFRKAEIVCGFAFGFFVVGKSAFRNQFGGGIGDESSLSGWFWMV